MQKPTAVAHNGPMSEPEHPALFDLAVDLAHQAFAEPDDEHVMCIYSRLLWNWQRGIGDDGAVTVH